MNQEKPISSDENKETGSSEGERMNNPFRLQLDPGLLDWRYYRIGWSGSEIFADIIATNTAGGGYNADKEYWLVNKANLTAQTSLIVSSLGDKTWSDATPSPPAQSQEIVANTEATWTQVGTDLTTGTLYKHSTQDYYVRVTITGTAPNATITTLRWYQAGSSQPAATFNPSGTYSSVANLSRGTLWYADSKSP